MSSEPETAFKPPGQNETERIISVWPFKILIFSPVLVFHNMIDLSREQEIIFLPSEL
jgi:hypothetical protein